MALAGETDVDPLDDDGEELGLLELMERLDVNGTHLGELVTELVALMGEFQQTATPISEELQGADHNKGRIVLIRMAEAVRGIAQRMDEVGTELEVTTTKVDGDLRATWALVEEYGSIEILDSVRTSILGSSGENFSGLTETETTMTSILNEMRSVEVLSVPLRNALRPLRKGITSARSAVLTMRSWSELVSQESTH